MTTTPRISLVEVLRGNFDLPLLDLSPELRSLVDEQYFPIPWDMLTAAQREDLAQQLDHLNDPTHQYVREYWFEFVAEKQKLDEQIAEWTAQQTRTITEAITKEERLEDLHAEMRALEKAYEEATEVGSPLFPPKVQGETPRQRKDRLDAWYLCEKIKKKRGAITRTAVREGVSRQTLTAILNRPK